MMKRKYMHARSVAHAIRQAESMVNAISYIWAYMYFQDGDMRNIKNSTVEFYAKGVLYAGLIVELFAAPHRLSKKAFGPNYSMYSETLLDTDFVVVQAFVWWVTYQYGNNILFFVLFV